MRVRERVRVAALRVCARLSFSRAALALWWTNEERAADYACTAK